MGKKQPKHLWAKFLSISPLYFLVIFLIISGVAVFALRSNNEMMAKLRNDVYQADQNNGNVTAALHNLQNYVYSHMNTDLSSGPNSVYPPIQLKYTYNRLYEAEQQRVASINSQVYTDAQTYCQQQNPVSFSGRTRVPCIEAYVQSHGAKAATIPVALYEFDFVSPAWSPDLAGWSLVFATLSLILFLFSFFNNRLRRHRRRALALKNRPPID